MAPDLKVQFRPGPLDAELRERAAEQSSVGYSVAAARDLGRYYELLRLALASVSLTEGEAGALVDIANGTAFEPLTVAAQTFHYEIEDGLKDADYAGKWEIDGPALVAKIRGWSLLQRAAVIDAIERFWGDSYHVENTRARLIRVGLVNISGAD